jgi:hypothetical protein
MSDEKSDKITMQDIPFFEDLFFAMMNIEAAEEHLEFAAARTGKQVYLEFANEISKIRAEFCPMIETNKDCEIHCLSKHLKLSFKRLEESGVKFARLGDFDKAMKLLKSVADVFEVYWLIQKMGGNKDGGKGTTKKTA